MRKLLFVAAAAAFVMAMPFQSKPAFALALPMPLGVNDAAAAIDVTENVRCWRVRRCGRYGCVWRRVCSGPYYYPYYRPYGYYRPYYGYRPYRYRRWRY
jgi:hypothetical protein